MAPSRSVATRMPEYCISHNIVMGHTEFNKPTDMRARRAIVKSPIGPQSKALRSVLIAIATYVYIQVPSDSRMYTGSSGFAHRLPQLRVEGSHFGISTIRLGR